MAINKFYGLVLTLNLSMLILKVSLRQYWLTYMMFLPGYYRLTILHLSIQIC